MKIDLSFSAAPVLFSMLLLAIFMVIWLYRRTIPPVSPWLRNCCMVMRLLTTLLILMLIFGPLLEFHQIQIRKPRVAMLTDISASMQIRDVDSTRFHQASLLAESPAMQRWMKGVDLKRYGFSDQIYPVSEKHPLTPEGLVTNLTQSIRQAIAEPAETPLRGILIFTDGRTTTGGPPHDTAMRSGIPVSGIVFGREEEQPDLILADVVANDLVYQGKETPVQVTLRGPGFAGRRVEITLSDGDSVLQRIETEIPRDGLQKTARMTFAPQWLGERALKVAIAPISHELTHENNQRDFYMIVRKSKIRVCLWGGAPHPDLMTLSRQLVKDEQIRLLRRTQKGRGLFYENPFPDVSVLHEQDVMILMHVPNQATPSDQWENMVSVIHEAKKPVFILVGAETDMHRLKQLEERLPVTGNRSRSEMLLSPRLTESGKRHVLLFDDAHDLSSEATWEKLAPIYSSHANVGVRAEAELLLKGKAPNVSMDAEAGVPLLVARHVGTEKTVLFLGNGLNRWDLLAQGMGRSHAAAGDLIHNIIHWLAAMDAFKPVRLSADQAVYSEGESVRIQARVYTESGSPVVRADVHAEISGPDSARIRLESQEPGLYRQAYRLRKQGDYRMIAHAVQDRQLLGTDTLDVHVTDFNPEFLNTRANPDLLRQLASLSGGASGPADSLDAVLASLIFSDEPVQRIRKFPLSASAGLLMLLMALMGVEWLIRRRAGMI